MKPFSFSKDFLHSRTLSNVIKGGYRYLFGARGKRLVNGLRLFYRLRVLILLRTGEPLSKISRNNEVRLWIDGKKSFRRIERLIGRAKHSVVVQMFIWKDDHMGRRMASTLLAAARRGVNVDVSKEAVGDIFELQKDFIGTKNSTDSLWQEFWAHPRIRISHTTNNDHSKVYVIDDQLLLLTGMNIADEYRYEWHDYLVEMRGSAYVSQYLTHDGTSSLSEDTTLVMNTSDRKNMRPVVSALLDAAQESVMVEHCYLLDPAIIDQLIALSKRGVRVTVIVPQFNDFHSIGNNNTIGRLIAEGDSSTMTVLLYPTRFHAKVLLVDYTSALIGSANLMKNSLDEMSETNVLIRGRKRVVRTLRESLREDVLRCRVLNSAPSFLWISRWLAWLGL